MSQRFGSYARTGEGSSFRDTLGGGITVGSVDSVCDLCHVRYGQAGLLEHRKSRGHKNMEFLKERGMWPGSGQCEVYLFLRKGSPEIYCNACKVLLEDSTELFSHQASAEHIGFVEALFAGTNKNPGYFCPRCYEPMNSGSEALNHICGQPSRSRQTKPISSSSASSALNALMSIPPPSVPPPTPISSSTPTISKEDKMKNIENLDLSKKIILESVLRPDFTGVTTAPPPSLGVDNSFVAMEINSALHSNRPDMVNYRKVCQDRDDLGQRLVHIVNEEAAGRIATGSTAILKLKYDKLKEQTVDALIYDQLEFLTSRGAMYLIPSQALDIINRDILLPQPGLVTIPSLTSTSLRSNPTRQQFPSSGVSSQLGYPASSGSTNYSELPRDPYLARESTTQPNNSMKAMKLKDILGHLPELTEQQMFCLNNALIPLCRIRCDGLVFDQDLIKSLQHSLLKATEEERRVEESVRYGHANQADLELARADRAGVERMGLRIGLGKRLEYVLLGGLGPHIQDSTALEILQLLLTKGHFSDAPQEPTPTPRTSLAESRYHSMSRTERIRSPDLARPLPTPRMPEAPQRTASQAEASADALGGLTEHEADQLKGVVTLLQRNPALSNQLASMLDSVLERKSDQTKLEPKPVPQPVPPPSSGVPLESFSSKSNTEKLETELNRSQYSNPPTGGKSESWRSSLESDLANFNKSTQPANAEPERKTESWRSSLESGGNLLQRPAPIFEPRPASSKLSTPVIKDSTELYDPKEVLLEGKAKSSLLGSGPGRGANEPESWKSNISETPTTGMPSFLFRDRTPQEEKLKDGSGTRDALLPVPTPSAPEYGRPQLAASRRELHSYGTLHGGFSVETQRETPGNVGNRSALLSSSQPNPQDYGRPLGPLRGGFRGRGPSDLLSRGYSNLGNRGSSSLLSPSTGFKRPFTTPSNRYRGEKKRYLE